MTYRVYFLDSYCELMQDWRMVETGTGRDEDGAYWRVDIGREFTIRQQSEGYWPEFRPEFQGEVLDTFYLDDTDLDKLDQFVTSWSCC